MKKIFTKVQIIKFRPNICNYEQCLLNPLKLLSSMLISILNNDIVIYTHI